LRSGKTLEELLKLSPLNINFLYACEKKSIEEENEMIKQIGKLAVCPLLFKHK